MLLLDICYEGMRDLAEDEKDTKLLPLLPLRGLTVFPYMVLHFDVGRKKSIAALEQAMVNDQMILLASQKDIRYEEPTEDEIFKVGTISRIKQLLKLPGDTIRVLVEGINRASIVEYKKNDPYYEVEIEEDKNEYKFDHVEFEALRRLITNALEEYSQISNRISSETVMSLTSVEDPSQLSDIIAANILVNMDDKQNILELFNPMERLEKIYQVLKRETEISEVEKKINVRVKNQIDQVQKEYFLREQMKAIQKELGDRDDLSSEIEEYKSKIKKMKLPKEADEKAKKELDRLSKTPAGSAEAPVIRNYLDWILALPWNTETNDNLDLKNVEKILNKEHYGLDKVKERILEYLAIRKLKKNMKGPILCFIGPPGVGKTSIARSIAKSLGRKFVRMSLGGVKDEAEIRGHRRTYVGAIPGGIISSLKIAGSKNPVFLLDEIDKMGNDYRGDPASAMLEVLDSEQNNTFRDHYLELPFDLSKILFITTANTYDTIPRPLMDRMEIIEISGYTDIEKLNIAEQHLVAKQIKENGLKKTQLSISENALKSIINDYTREAGVRELERQIANVCRKAATRIVTKKAKSIKVTEVNLRHYLGIQKYFYDKIQKHDEIGIVTGLAWTTVGGETLSIEVTPMKGTGKLVLTGQLGDVMKESATAGLSYIRSKADEFGITPDFYENTDIHIHIPEGAIPKDGPSAGITMATAMISALTRIPVYSNVAMTGEITLRGRVLPIGGLKEKSLAAHRAGITKIIIPYENLKDLEEIPQSVKRKIEFVTVEYMDQVLENALVHMPNGRSNDNKES